MRISRFTFHTDGLAVWVVIGLLITLYIALCMRSPDRTEVRRLVAEELIESGTDERTPASILKRTRLDVIDTPNASDGGVIRPTVGTSSTPALELIHDLPTLKNRLFTRRPDLNEYKRLEEKVLRTASEFDSYTALLSNRKMIRSIGVHLQANSDTILDPERQLEHIYQVDYLNRAIAWQDNPHRSDAIREIRLVVLTENLSSDLPLDLRKSLAADKLELFHGLAVHAPQEIERLLADAKGTPLQPLLREAERWSQGFQKQALANVVAQRSL